MSRMKAHPRVFWHRLKDHIRRFGWIWLAVFLILSLVNHRWHLALTALTLCRSSSLRLNEDKRRSKSEITWLLNLSLQLSEVTV